MVRRGPARTADLPERGWAQRPLCQGKAWSQTAAQARLYLGPAVFGGFFFSSPCSAQKQLSACYGAA